MTLSDRSAAAAWPVTDESTESPADGIISAFVLGWHVAELFHAKIPQSTRPRTATRTKLPGIGELDSLSRAQLLLAQVQADLSRVWRLDDSGGQPPDSEVIRSLLEAPSRRPGELQDAVLEFHRQLLVALTAADFRRGKAYGLGRALAESVLLPDARDPESIRQAFARYRLVNLFFWLADLKSAFPPHAAEAVLRSLFEWSSWVEAPTLLLADGGQHGASEADAEGRPPGPQPRLQIGRVAAASWGGRNPVPAKTRAVDWESGQDRESVMRALHRQGQLWLAMLSGERDCLGFLSTDDYLRAGGRLIGDIRQLAFQFVRHFWLVTTMLLVLAAAAIISVFAVHATGAVVTAVVTVAGVISISWKGAASGLERVLQQLQRPLWERELQAAIAVAATQLPRERRPGQRPIGSPWQGEEAEAGASPEPPDG
jgi:hypothetical protein